MSVFSFSFAAQVAHDLYLQTGCLTSRARAQRQEFPAARTCSPFQKAASLAYCGPLNFMLRNKHTIQSQARALFLLLILLSGWVAVPVAAAMPKPVTCGMVCCEESGVCYCAHPQAENSQVHTTTPTAGAQTARTEITRKNVSCGEKCASLAASNLSFSVAYPVTPCLQPLPDGLVPLPTSEAPAIQSLLVSGDCAPRAPPVHKLV